MKHRLLTLCLWVGGMAGAWAQQETTLGTMRSLPQSTYLNPAFVPAQPFYIGLPGISSVAVWGSSNSLSYNTLFVENAEGEAEFNLDHLRSALRDKNWVQAGAQVDLFGIGLRASPRLYLRYRASIKAHQSMMVPGDLLKLVDEEFQSSPANIELEPSVNALAYAEHSVGGSYLLTDKLTLGANLKRFNGLFNVHTQSLNMKLTTLPDAGRMRLEGEMLVQVTGEELADDPTEASIRQYLRSNGGWGLDLGATYQYSDRLQLGLSLQNLGFINWKGGAREYRVNRTSVEFDAFTEQDVEDESEAFEEAIDAISEAFEPQERDIDGYRTGLPTRLYANATYQLHRSVHTTGVLFAEVYGGRLMPGFTAAIHKDFGRRLGAALSYTAVNGSYANFGTGLSFRLTPFQLYVVTDNVLAGLDYKNARSANVRLGMNLVFGTTKKESKLPY
ncbi:DUF5723 family protein [Cesiribacter andamanensis]|nr:DUF5723 family protein [Cesiribacter andamanensis]